MQRLGDVQRDGRPDQAEQRERAHRQPERVQRGVGDLDRRALVDRGDDLTQQPGQQPVDDEAGRIAHEHGVLAQPGRHRERGRQVASSVCSARTTSTSGKDRDRVEEVQADDPLRVLQPGRHRADRQRRRVRGKDGRRVDVLLELGEDRLLDASSSNTASITRSASANAA